MWMAEIMAHSMLAKIRQRSTIKIVIVLLPCHLYIHVYIDIWNDDIFMYKPQTTHVISF